MLCSLEECKTSAPRNEPEFPEIQKITDKKPFYKNKNPFYKDKGLVVMFVKRFRVTTRILLIPVVLEKRRFFGVRLMIVSDNPKALKTNCAVR